MSTDFVRQFNVGQATVTVVNIGDIYLPLAQYMNVPAEAVTTDLAAQTLIPIHATHIQLPHTSVLVDAGLYDVETEPEYAIPNYVPPPGLVAQLGISVEKIEHVIITHRHWDHFNGTTVLQNGEYVPQFPQARYYLGEPDWERVQTAMQDPASVEAHTLGVLHQRGLLELVSGNRDLGHGIQILAAPGETAGHQIVRLHSEGETLYCLGDLYHHPIEFAHSECKVSWAKAETIATSRQALTPRALEERALLVATHIPAIGRLLKTGLAWEAVL